MFATIEKGGKFCFASQDHDVFDVEGEGKDDFIIEIWVVFVSVIEMIFGTTFCILAQTDRMHWCVWQGSCHWLGTGWWHGGVWQHSKGADDRPV